MKKLLSLLIFSITLPLARSSLLAAGTTGAQILELGGGARAISMGEAYTALADDNSSIYWNPAGLGMQSQGQASFMYNQFLKDQTLQHGSIGVPVEFGGFGAGISYLNYGDIDGYDAMGNPTGGVKANSAVFSFGGAYLAPDWSWSAGSTVKVVQQTLADEKASTYAMDLGAQYILPWSIFNGATVRLGAAATNIGPGIKFLQERDPLPMEIKGGVSVLELMNRHLSLSADFVKPRDNPKEIRGGAEYWVGRYLALRAGYVNTEREGNGLRAGMGIRVGHLSFDYAYANYGELGLSHRYELSYRFGQPRAMLGPEERRMMREAKQALSEGEYSRSVLLFNSVLDLVPSYGPAKRYLRTAMNRMEGAEYEAKRQMGTPYTPVTSGKTPKHDSPELDDLEQMFSQAEKSDNALAQKEAASKKER